MFILIWFVLWLFNGFPIAVGWLIGLVICYILDKANW